MKNILVTGGAGFIGSSLVDLLLEDPLIKITSLDNFDSFYDSSIKRRNIENQLKKTNFKLIEADVSNLQEIEAKTADNYDAIIHLAAKVGVRTSVLEPLRYTKVNILGTQNLLEIARKRGYKKFIFASSSSVYGVNPNTPWKEDDHLLLPTNPYALTKISGDLMRKIYSDLFGLQFIALRLFTVYGPRQRPDLAIHKFANLIFQGEPIQLYGDGGSKRDYTYIDDIIMGFKAALDYSSSQYEIINLGNNQPIKLTKLIFLLEKVFKKKARIKKMPNQPGDLPITFADIEKAEKLLGYQPKIDIQSGLQKFSAWFRTYNIY